MEITNPLYISSRAQWRRWLKKHYKTEKEIWLVYPKKHTGEARISYNDAVEEALCFGWIDSTQKSLDSDHSAQRYSPRKPGSSYSQANKERLRALVAGGKVAADVLKSLRGVLDEEFRIAPDILAEIKADKKAWMNFQAFSPSYQRIRIAFIEGARNRPEEFEKRLRYFIKMTALNKQFGFGGIEEHF